MCVSVCEWLLFVTHSEECFASVGTDRFSGLTSSLLICRHQQKPAGCFQTERPAGRADSAPGLSFKTLSQFALSNLRAFTPSVCLVGVRLLTLCSAQTLTYAISGSHLVISWLLIG